jgi:hypothetical protein
MVSQFLTKRVDLATGDIWFEKNLELHSALPTSQRVCAGISGHQPQPHKHDSNSDRQDRCDRQGEVTTYIDPSFVNEVAGSA